MRQFKVIIISSKLTGDFTPSRKQTERFFLKTLNVVHSLGTEKNLLSYRLKHSRKDDFREVDKFFEDIISETV
jgi:hypothetical protein